MYAISRQSATAVRAAAPWSRLYAVVLPAVAAVLSAIAAGIHAAVTDEYLAAWWGYGIFFFVLTMAQAGFALLVLTERRPGVLAAGVAVNVAVVALYFVTRAIAIPLGPRGGEAATVGRLDALATVAEGGSVLVLVLLLGHALANAPTRSREQDAEATGADDR